MGWLVAGVVVTTGWLIAGGVLALVVWALYSASERRNWDQFVDRECAYNQENVRRFHEERTALAKKLGQSGAPITPREVDALRQTYNKIINFCDSFRYKCTEELAPVRKGVTEAFAAIYEKASYRASVSLSGEAQAVDVLLDAYHTHFLSVKGGLDAGEISSEQVSKLCELGYELRRAQPTVAKHFDAKKREDVRGILERHEGLVRSLPATAAFSSR